jgi:hypothetical protein
MRSHGASVALEYGYVRHLVAEDLFEKRPRARCYCRGDPNHAALWQASPQRRPQARADRHIDAMLKAVEAPQGAPTTNLVVPTLNPVQAMRPTFAALRFYY